MAAMTTSPETSPAGGPPDATMQVIPTEECYRLLATQEIGRIGVNAEHYPLILPVNYAVDGTTLVIRTRPGTILRAAEHANVTFEVDQIDPQTRSGWSVLVRGQAEEVGAEHRAELVARTHSTGVQPWAPGEHGNWLRVIAHDVSGRRIVPGELPPAVDPRAYL
jgi:nitroimidazol reductase NimA-like FMN-containing flavoprotein (pyridoxamine 5'-phosphate oxidase superfamily)